MSPNDAPSGELDLELLKDACASRGNGSLSCRGTVDAEHELFCHHFAGSPVLPAFVQLGWIEQLTLALTGAHIDRFKSVKFLGVLRGGEELEISITSRSNELIDNPASYSFTVTSTDKIVTSGIFTVSRDKEV